MSNEHFQTLLDVRGYIDASFASPVPAIFLIIGLVLFAVSGTRYVSKSAVLLSLLLLIAGGMSGAVVYQIRSSEASGEIIDTCRTIFEEIENGRVKWIHDDNIKLVTEFCGGWEPLQKAANSPNSKLGLNKTSE